MSFTLAPKTNSDGIGTALTIETVHIAFALLMLFL